jgi:sodium transport system permease protein
MAKESLRLVFLDKFDPHWREDRKLDVIIEESEHEHFFTRLDHGDEIGSQTRPLINLHTKPGDHRSVLAQRRVLALLEVWRADLKRVRLARKGLGESELDPFDVHLPEQASAGEAQDLVSMVIRIFPLVLVMWSLSGALYPAIDLCAGEKERGTMETLLITPAGREEIVLGKFLTIWVFSSATAILNLLSMGATTAFLSSHLPHGVSIEALAWCVVLSLPQSAFFSALGLAIGAYARSSKEGQYYLMPLFVVTMPLIFLTLVPGVELNALYALVPVTGVSLLMQQLMTTPSLDQVPWRYFIPVLGPMALYSWLALRWAIVQFHREEVLFREAERLDVVLWFKRLLREKEPVPTTGEAFFCLALLIGLRWLTLGMGARWSLEMHTAISELAFVAMPPIFMILLLNTEPAMSLYLRWPRKREAGLGALLAILLLPPMTGLTQAAAEWFPELLRATHPLIEILVAVQAGADFGAAQLVTYLLAFALVPALCEEIAFRGFVLRGLHQGFRPRNAVLLSSFFFALFHMNVFLFVPMFVLGVILGLLTIRSRSLLPAISFHLLHNSVLIALIPLGHYSSERVAWLHDAWPWLIGGCLAAALALVWWLYRRPYARNG